MLSARKREPVKDMRAHPFGAPFFLTRCGLVGDDRQTPYALSQAGIWGDSIGDLGPKFSDRAAC